jgi:hypothetical protein
MGTPTLREINGQIVGVREGWGEFLDIDGESIGEVCVAEGIPVLFSCASDEIPEAPRLLAALVNWATPAAIASVARRLVDGEWEFDEGAAHLNLEE